MRFSQIEHRFVDVMPEKLEAGVMYVSIEFTIAVHMCLCGCGQEVVTPLSPTDWKFTFDGETVSLDPSVGNWSFECQSHYWIKRNLVKWAGQMSKEQIAAVRAEDIVAKGAYFDDRGREIPQQYQTSRSGMFARFLKWFSG